MQSRMNVGHRVGPEARRGTIIHSSWTNGPSFSCLEVDAWHRLSFKKMIRTVSQQSVPLGTSAQPAEWNVGPRKRKS